MKHTVIALILLGPLSVASFSNSLHSPSTQTLHPSTRRSISSSRLFVSNGFDLEGSDDGANSNLSSFDYDNERKHPLLRFRPRQLVSTITQTVVSTAPAIHRRVRSLPRGLLSRINILERQRATTITTAEETAKIEKQSQNWILRTVVGLNLCPFAFPSLKNHQVKLIVVRGTNEDEIAQVVVQELLLQKESPSGGNSIVVAPDYHPDDFYGYMNMVQYLEEAPMTQLDLHGHVQIAPFHPHFVFDFKQMEEKKNPIDNYVNRSPYPMFHILKEHDVDHAVATACGGDPGKVWRRNARLLRKFEDVMGKQGAVDFLLSFSTKDQMPEYPEETVNQVMKEVRQDGDRHVEGMVRGVWEK